MAIWGSTPYRTPACQMLHPFKMWWAYNFCATSQMLKFKGLYNHHPHHFQQHMLPWTSQLSPKFGAVLFYTAGHLWMAQLVGCRSFGFQLKHRKFKTNVHQFVELCNFTWPMNKSREFWFLSQLTFAFAYVC